jgi:hypothetical protein
MILFEKKFVKVLIPAYRSSPVLLITESALTWSPAPAFEDKLLTVTKKMNEKLVIQGSHD